MNLLEETTIRTLARFNIRGSRTENPGVWVDEETKIAALGVHLRRNVTSYGVGLNLSTDLRWFDRIAACGLEGKKTTSIKAQGAGLENSEGIADLQPLGLANIWASEFAKGLWGEEGRVEAVKGEQL